MITYRKTISIIQNSSINPFSNAHHKVLSHSGIRYTLPKINCQNTKQVSQSESNSKLTCLATLSTLPDYVGYGKSFTH